MTNDIVYMDSYGNLIRNGEIEAALELPSVPELLEVIRGLKDIVSDQHNTLLKQNQVLKFHQKRLKEQGAHVIGLEQRIVSLETAHKRVPGILWGPN